jgi:hypothetical protein
MSTAIEGTSSEALSLMVKFRELEKFMHTGCLFGSTKVVIWAGLEISN